MGRYIGPDDVNDGGGLPDEGRYYCEVKECKEKQSKKGEAYYSLGLADVRSGGFLAYDVVMLEGRGNGMGLKKLEALGAANKDDAGGWHVADAGAVVGARAYVVLKHETYNGKTRAKVDVGATDWCGFAPENFEEQKAEPAKAAAGKAPAPDPSADAFEGDDIPF